MLLKKEKKEKKIKFKLCLTKIALYDRGKSLSH